jgi:hypothetical protein
MMAVVAVVVAVVVVVMAGKGRGGAGEMMAVVAVMSWLMNIITCPVVQPDQARCQTLFGAHPLPWILPSILDSAIHFAIAIDCCRTMKYTKLVAGQ